MIAPFVLGFICGMFFLALLQIDVLKKKDLTTIDGKAKWVKRMCNTVFLLTTGDGSDGNEWGVQSIHSSRESAEAAQVKYSRPMETVYGSMYVRESQIEEWAVDEVNDIEIPAERLKVLE